MALWSVRGVGIISVLQCEYVKDSEINHRSILDCKEPDFFVHVNSLEFGFFVLQILINHKKVLFMSSWPSVNIIYSTIEIATQKNLHIRESF